MMFVDVKVLPFHSLVANINFYFQVLMKNYFIYDRLHDPPLLSALNLYIIISCDIFNQVLLVPSCYLQWFLKIFIITLLSMQVKALQITGAELHPLSFLFCIVCSHKRM